MLETLVTNELSLLTGSSSPQGKTLEQVDYLFVQKGLAGLRKNFDVTEDDMLEAFEHREKVGERVEEVETAR